MAKFNKDRFINDITGKVQSAIDRHFLTKEDIDNNDLERLHSFIQYELVELIDDRKFSLDVLNDFNYDEKTSWRELQEEFGQFKTIKDIALVNLWKFMENEGATEYSYYHKSDLGDNATLLDMAREDDKFKDGEGGTEEAPEETPHIDEPDAGEGEPNPEEGSINRRRFGDE
jgi:hypothetical protein